MIAHYHDISCGELTHRRAAGKGFDTQARLQVAAPLLPMVVSGVSLVNAVPFLLTAHSPKSYPLPSAVAQIHSCIQLPDQILPVHTPQ